MEYEKRIRCLENYRVRSIPKDIVTTNSEGDEIVDKLSPRYFYGKIPDFKIDKNFNYILDGNGQKIPNTIPINIFLKHKYDDIGIFTNSIYTDDSDKIIDKTPEVSDPEVAGYFCYGDEEHTMNVYSCYAAQTITQIQDAQADGFSVFLTSNYGSAQDALAACQSNCAPPFDGDGGIEGDASLCSGDLQLNAIGGITYIMINGSPLPQSCCVMDVTGTVVYWDGQFCRPR